MPPAYKPSRETSAIASKPPTEPPAKKRRRSNPRGAGPVPLAATPGTPRKKAAAAGPRRGTDGKTQAVRPRAEPQPLDHLQALIVDSLEGDKAEAIVALDLAGRASFADRMIIATGIADRQLSTMATHLGERLHSAGIRRVQIEGAGGADWVLIDAGDIIVHLFKPEARAMYALEKMWGAELDEAERGDADTG